MTNEFEYKNVKNVYEEIASHFNDTRKYQWEWIEEFRNNYNDKHLICDIGCGNGRNMGINTIGVDNCHNFLEICKQKGLNVVNSDMTHLPFSDNSFDAIQSIASFHHLSNHERRLQSLQEMVRILKPGGRILFSVWSKTQPKKTRHNFDYGDNFVKWKKLNGEIYNRYYYIFNLEELKNMFHDVGLNIESYKWDYGNEIFILYK